MQAQTNYWYFHMAKYKTARLKRIHRVMIYRVGGRGHKLNLWKSAIQTGMCRSWKVMVEPEQSFESQFTNREVDT